MSTVRKNIAFLQGVAYVVSLVTLWWDADAVCGWPRLAIRRGNL